MASARQSDVLDEDDIASGSLRRLFTTWSQCGSGVKCAPPPRSMTSPYRARVDAIVFSTRLERMALEDETCLAVFPMPLVDHPDDIERFRGDLCSICDAVQSGAAEYIQIPDAVDVAGRGQTGRGQTGRGQHSIISAELFSLDLLTLYVRALCSNGRPFVGRFENLDAAGTRHRQEHLVLPLSRCGTRVDTVFVAATHSENRARSRESACQDTIKLGRKNVRLTREVMQ